MSTITQPRGSAVDQAAVPAGTPGPAAPIAAATEPGAGTAGASVRIRRLDRLRRSAPTIALHAAFVLVVLVAWQLASGTLIDPLLVSSPIEVLARLGDWIVTGHLFFHAQFTLIALAAGFTAGAVVAFALAVVLAGFPRFGRFAEIYIIVFNGIPTIALVPLFIVWFGFGLETKIFMGYLTAFFIVFIASFQGLRSTDPKYLELARVLEASRLQTLFRFRIQATLPFLASAFKLALPATALAVVTAEFLGSNRGLGYLLIRASNLLDMASLFAAVLIVTALVQALSLTASSVESRLLVWIPKEKR
ncbi:ABC transporter permease [Agromyces intestinalis]|uniref:ABC transporter permease n=1 Tax=Agromyces intestinalis TaxID=2592652 RepID=A0A5C1YF93_9MICO|nr:ABC transporter permease [Agromyces intestinalis]QEO14836.1 ABC transporter permease [Agromyces intestinalis]